MLNTDTGAIIERAFANSCGTPFPVIDFPYDAEQDIDIAEINTYFAGKKWQEIPAADLPYYQSALIYFSADAWACFLPAFLRGILDEAVRWNIYDPVLNTLTPPPATYRRQAQAPPAAAPDPALQAVLDADTPAAALTALESLWSKEPPAATSALDEASALLAMIDNLLPDSMFDALEAALPQSRQAFEEKVGKLSDEQRAAVREVLLFMQQESYQPFRDDPDYDALRAVWEID